MTYSAKVIAGGKIVIPAELRRTLGVQEGDRLVIEEDGKGGLTLKTYAQVVSEVQEKYKAMIKEPFTVDDFIAERRAEAAREDKEAAAPPKRRAGRPG